MNGWIGYASVRSDVNGWVESESKYYYLQLDDFYRQRKPNKSFPHLQYKDVHFLGIL